MAHPGRISDPVDGRRVARAPALALPVTRVLRSQGDPESLIEHEWLVTNGLGGYSSGTIAGVITRRYHGVLVAALQNPLGRMIMLNELSDGLDIKHLTEFRTEGGIPIWRFDIDGTVIEKRIVMPYRQNTVIVQYRLEQGSGELRLTPGVHFRGYEAPVTEPLLPDYAFASESDGYFVWSSSGTDAGLPHLRFRIEGAHAGFELKQSRREQILYPVEESRGYRGHGALWSPGSFVLKLEPGVIGALIASAENPDTMLAVPASDSTELENERKRRLLAAAAAPAQNGLGAQLVIAADQFIIRPVGRVRDTVRAAAVGDQVRTVIAGYHWFTDWGRDTMISLEGLTLTTGRHREAGFILRTFAQYVRDGLIPNFFPDGKDLGLYHTADATLWFFNALQRYAEVTEYWQLIEQTLPVLREIAEHHIYGTHYGIGVDARDGLLRQGADGYQLTWMDAKVDGWVVTPRRGKAVEINALWYNALSLLARWECDFGDQAASRKYEDMAARSRESFNRRFWNDATGHLFDVVDCLDGHDDPSCRPNQLFSISLPNPVLDQSHWQDVMDVVQKKLLTPVGLRSLSPDHPDYKPKYFGDLRTRDAAYHQGTVWAWLIGPWIDAWLKVHPDDKKGARRFLDGFIAHLSDFGVGSVAEIFDAEPPYTPRGCVAQAWSVAEVLRCWVKTA